MRRQSILQVPKWVKFGMIFLAMAAVTIASGYYRDPMAAEAEGRFFFRLDIPQASEQTVMVDLAEHSWPKYLFQPGRVQISGRIQGPAAMMARPVELLVTATSLQNTVALRSSAPNLVTTAQGYRTLLIPGRGTPLSFVLDIPYEHTRRPAIDTIVVRVTDRDRQYLLGQVIFVISNSRADSV